MAKHDKETRFSWDVPDTDYLIAENKKLRAENERLKTLVKTLENDTARSDRSADRAVQKAQAIIDQKDAEIARWKAKALGLVDAYV